MAKVKAKKAAASTSYREDKIARLRDPGYAAEYLKAAIEEEDLPEVFLQALKNVAEARGMANVAEEADMHRESLYRMLSKKGNPRLDTLYAILNALGFRLSVEPVTEKVS